MSSLASSTDIFIFAFSSSCSCPPDTVISHHPQHKPSNHTLTRCQRVVCDGELDGQAQRGSKFGSEGTSGVKMRRVQELTSIKSLDLRPDSPHCVQTQQLVQLQHVYCDLCVCAYLKCKSLYTLWTLTFGVLMIVGVPS